MANADIFIDSVSIIDSEYNIRGWISYKDKIDIKIKSNNNVIQSNFKLYYRPDVVRSYKEEGKDIEVNPKCGFLITTPDLSLKKIKIVFLADESEEIYDLDLIAWIKTSKNYIKKGFYFLFEHGLIELFKKIMNTFFLKNRNVIYTKWLKNHLPSEDELHNQKETVFEYSPKISIVIPLYKTPKKYLNELVDSIINQTYSNWELCLSDGSGENSPIKKILKNLKQQDNRIKVVSSDKPLQISDNTNLAISIATGEYIGFADHDDLLTPDALFNVVKALNNDQGIEMLYSDEDKVSMNGKHYFEPHFKSDFNIDMLRSLNYICHFLVVKKTLLDKVGQFDPDYNGAQDYDFILRCIENTDNIYHISRILYHWRSHRLSTAENPESKIYAFEAGQKAIQAHFDRLNIPATVEVHEPLGLYKTTYNYKEQPLISIIIPNKDHTNDLEKCINSIETKSKYPNIEYIIIENNSEFDETFSYYKELEERNSRVKIVYYEGIFNFSKINNFGVNYANGEYLLFLNNDTTIINSDCLEQMLGVCMREDVGIVGCKLYYDDDTIQHAGVVIGFGGIAGHTFIGFDKDDPGYFNRLLAIQDYSAVTAACMLTKKSLFKSVNGFTEDLAVAFNDIDYCLKIRSLDKLIVFQPFAELYHYESKSRGLEDSPEKVERFQKEIAEFAKRWPEILQNGDPYYNSNLSLNRSDFGIKSLEELDQKNIV